MQLVLPPACVRPNRAAVQLHLPPQSGVPDSQLSSGALTRIYVSHFQHLPLSQRSVSSSGRSLPLRSGNRRQQLRAVQGGVGIHCQGEAQLAQGDGLRLTKRQHVKSGLCYATTSDGGLHADRKHIMRRADTAWEYTRDQN